LRALVLLPTRDLALQVKRVFDALVLGTDLKVHTALGQTSMSDEQAALCSPWNEDDGPPAGGLGKVDILVATPGRLLDHISTTVGFTLQHVRFLVIDETDRLLRQSYQDWVVKVLDAINTPITPREMHVRGLPYLDAVTARTSLSSRNVPPVRKMLFSATLTTNPEKLQSLQLTHPLFFSASHDGRYKTPDTLQENWICIDSGQKPLALLYVLDYVKHAPTIVFTSSVEATHRLHLLLHLYGGLSVAEFSSNLTQKERSAMLAKFINGEIQMLICSDAMTRGIDVQGVTVVVNYDAPKFAKTYVHRVGRTARAGTRGQVFTLVTDGELKPFKSMLRQCDNNYVRPLFIPPRRITEMTPRYEECLEDLKKHVLAEIGGGKAPETAREKKNIAAELERSATRQLVRNSLKHFAV